MIEDYIYLGQVKRRIDNEKGSIGQIKPLYCGEDETTYWKELTPDEIKEFFPNRGLVTWLNPPIEAIEGSVWQFYVEEQPSYDKNNERHEAFKVVSNPLQPAFNPVQPTEIIDMRKVGDSEQVRICLSFDGLELNYIPSSKVYLWADKQILIGPVHLSKISQGDNLWYLDKKQLEQPLPTFSAHEYELIEVYIDEYRWLLDPRVKMGGRRGLVDWSDDDSVLRHALHSLYVNSTNSFILTKKEITKAVRDLDISDTPILDDDLRKQQLQRAKKIVSKLEQRQKLIEELSTDILRIRSVAALINKAEEAAQEKAKNTIRMELADSIESVRSQEREIQQRIVDKEQMLVRLDEDIKTKQQYLRQLEEETIAQKAAQLAQLDTLEDTITERLHSIMQQPTQLLADVAIIRTALNLVPAPQTQHSPEPSQVPTRARTINVLSSVSPSHSSHKPSWMHSSEQQVAPLTTLMDTSKSLRKTFSMQGLSPALAKSLHAAFISGAFPVLVGSDAFSALRAYASCIAGGRFLWIPVSPTMLEPVDLFGKLDPSARCLMPQQSGLLDLLLHARHNLNDLYVVVLDGINRSAIDSYLLPLVACYRDRWLPEGKRVLPLFHPDMIAQDNPYQELSSLEWPQNVLLAGILSEGVTTIATPASLWDYAILLLLDRTPLKSSNDKNAFPHPQQPISQHSSVPLDTWQIWSEECRSSLAIPELLEDLLDEESGFSREKLSLCAQLYGALCKQLGDEAQASKYLLLQALIPHAINWHQTESFLGILKQVKDVKNYIREVEAVVEATERILA